MPESEVKRYHERGLRRAGPRGSGPGFRSGRAPRRLVEKQFKDRVVTEQVKGKLLMDSLSQVTEDPKTSRRSASLILITNRFLNPAEGPFKFQFSIEVRPEFQTPNWKGLVELTKPVEKIDDEARLAKLWIEFLQRPWDF